MFHILIVPLMQMQEVKEHDKHQIFCLLAVLLWFHSIWSDCNCPASCKWSNLDMQIHSQANFEPGSCTSQLIVIQAKSKVLVVGCNRQGDTSIYDMIDLL